MHICLLASSNAHRVCSALARRPPLCRAGRRSCFQTNLHCCVLPAAAELYPAPTAATGHAHFPAFPPAICREVLHRLPEHAPQLCKDLDDEEAAPSR